jgi:hypothetical protein
VDCKHENFNCFCECNRIFKDETKPDAEYPEKEEVAN